MTVNEFILYWQTKRDHDGSPAVGIGVHWDKIKQESKVLQFYGENAWEKIGEFYAPLWGNFDRTKLKEWLNPNRHDYQKFIDEEKSVGKIDLHATKGFICSKFCAFADGYGTKGILGDGSHRYIDCNYLMMKGIDLKEEIKKCRLDVMCLINIQEVLTPVDLQALS